MLLYCVVVIAQSIVGNSPQAARQLGTASIVITILGVVFAVVCWTFIAYNL